MTPAEAEDLARRILRAIGSCEVTYGTHTPETIADRERVESDLAGLRECDFSDRLLEPQGGHAARYAEGLLRTARLYGVTP